MIWRFWRGRGEPEDVRAARLAAQEAGRRLARVRRDDPVVRAESRRIDRVAAENNLVPVILRALRAGQ
jgi:hypothetical protein